MEMVVGKGDGQLRCQTSCFPPGLCNPPQLPEPPAFFLQELGWAPVEPDVGIQGLESLGEVATQSQLPDGLIGSVTFTEGFHRPQALSPTQDLQTVTQLHCGESPSAALKAKGTSGRRLWPARALDGLGGQERQCLHQEYFVSCWSGI